MSHSSRIIGKLLLEIRSFFCIPNTVSADHSMLGGRSGDKKEEGLVEEEKRADIQFFGSRRLPLTI